MYRDPPLSSTGDRQTSKPMAFVSPLQRKKPLCCQIDEKAFFAFLFVAAFVSFFCEKGTFYPILLTLKWSDAFVGRSA